MNASQPEFEKNEQPLSSWKEIGAYLQRNAATVRRWEKEEGLPVHRHSHKSRSSVYAYPSEIDAWRVTRKVVAEDAPAPVGTFWRAPAFASAILLSLVMIGNGARPQTASAKNGPLAKRLVCSNCGDPDGNVSQDGRWMAYTDWDSGDLAILDLRTGKSRRLLVKSGGWEDSDIDGETPVLSPDHRQIVYEWYLGKKSGGRSQLRLVLDQPGAKPRDLLDNADYTYYEPAAWFPDGKSVLVTLQKRDKTGLLARISIADSSINVLKKLDWRYFTGGSRPRISPDGRYIAYSARAVNPSAYHPAPSDPKDVHIYVLAADGSNETELVKTAGINRNQTWAQDGKHILFTSDRSGKIDLWSIPVQSGKAAGAEGLVVGDIGAEGLGFANGSFFYTSSTPADNVHIANLSDSKDPANTTFVGVSPRWSPDGKLVSFKRRHPGDTSRYDLVVRSLETGDETMPLAGIGTTGNGGSLWSGDGRSLSTGVWRNEGQRGFFRIDLKTRELTPFPTANGGLSDISPDGKTIYTGRKEGQNNLVVAIDVATGKEGVLYTSVSSPTIPTLSPDGSMLAVAWQEGSPGAETLHILRIPVDGAPSREVFRGDGVTGGFNQRVVWDRDGRSLLFCEWQNSGPNSAGRIMRVPTDGGPATVVFAAPRNIENFDVSPDGKRIVYSSNESPVYLWALDNVPTEVR